MTEKLLQFIWQMGYFNKTDLQTTNGEKLQVIHPGNLNSNQGPDFLDARIKTADTTFAGSVELHLKTSMWNAHQHQKDENYKNVILHVVFENDLRVNNIPVLELQSYIPKFLLEKYNGLMNATTFIPCANSIYSIRKLTWISWKERLLAERLIRKSTVILENLKTTNYHWEETFWQLLAKNFGIKVNAETFEQLARSISINILAKHKNSIHQIEALLFGQAALLDKDFNEEYPKLLKREYNFLKVKYNLKPIAYKMVFLRMRPSNFPTIRLAQLAMLIHKSSHLFSKIIEASTVKEINDLLKVTANDYWHYHYIIDEPSEYKPKKLGTTMINNIIINTVVPILYTYGHYHNNTSLKTKALQWLEATKPEDNSILNSFHHLQIENKSAYDSQALIELKNEYCNSKRCLQCSVGNAILKN